MTGKEVFNKAVRQAVQSLRGLGYKRISARILKDRFVILHGHGERIEIVYRDTKENDR